MRQTPRNVLSIAGSDPSGGAGIQADLKTFSALGAYGMSVITALTAQNTQGVSAVRAMDAGFLREQIDRIFDDIRVDAVKIGMIGSADSVASIAACLERYRPPFVVVDPVMVARSGDRLIDAEAVVALRDRLLPLADLITPNLPEAAVLLGEEVVRSESEFVELGERLLTLGADAALVKGGHLPGDACNDLLYRSGGKTTWLRVQRVQTTNTHGTGCTLSSAIAALWPANESLPIAVGKAKDYLTRALESADRLRVGRGHGPVHHFHALWNTPEQG